MNKDQIKGTLKPVEGQVKEQAGKVLDDNVMEAKGVLKNAEGKVQSAYGDVKEELKK